MKDESLSGAQNPARVLWMIAQSEFYIFLYDSALCNTWKTYAYDSEIDRLDKWNFQRPELTKRLRQMLDQSQPSQVGRK